MGLRSATKKGRSYFPLGVSKMDCFFCPLLQEWTQVWLWTRTGPAQGCASCLDSAIHLFVHFAFCMRWLQLPTLFLGWWICLSTNLPCMVLVLQDGLHYQRRSPTLFLDNCCCSHCTQWKYSPLLSVATWFFSYSNPVTLLSKANGIITTRSTSFRGWSW